MFEKETILVTGAGASKPFSFPLGEEMKSEIEQGLAYWSGQFYGAQIRALGEEQAIQDFYSGACEWLITMSTNYQNEGFKIGHPTIVEFEQALKHSTRDSVDRFIQEHSAYAELGRFFVSLSIIYRYLSRPSTRGNHQQEVAEPDANVARHNNWLKNLINHLRDECLTEEDVRNNKLEIITFNYDCSLDRILDRDLFNTELLGWKQPTNVVPIHHVYGRVRYPELSDLSSDIRSIYRLAWSAKDEIDFVRGAEFEGLKRKIASARRVYICGFAFDTTNCRNLGLSEHPDPSSIFVHSWSGDPRELRQAERLNIPSDNVTSGSTDSPIEVAAAFTSYDFCAPDF